MKENNLSKTIQKFSRNTCTHRFHAAAIPAKTQNDFAEFRISNHYGSCGELTPNALKRILNDANAGSTQNQAVCYRMLLEQEPVIASHIQTRIQAILSCDWQILGKDDKKVQEITGILNDAGIHLLIRQLLDALIFGYAGSAILWTKGGAGISGFSAIDPTNWIFDAEGNPAIVKQDGSSAALSHYHPNQFLFFCHKLQSCHPARGGLLRPLLWIYLYKNYAMHDRARYLERYGIPFLAATIRHDDFESEEIRKTVMESLQHMGSDGVGLLSEGADLQLLQSSGNAADEYQSWLEYLDRVCALMILGQTASSDNASGFSKGQIQENIRRDLLEADCQLLMTCLNRQLIAPLEYYRYGSKGELKFKLDYSYADNLVEKSTIVKNLSDAGYVIDPAWISSTFGVQLCKTSDKKQEEQ